MNTTGRRPSLSDSDVEALLAGRVVPAHPGLQDVLRVIRAAADVPAPAPSAALAAVLAAGFEPSPMVVAVPAPTHWRRRAAQITLAVVAGLTATAGAAAANVLPPAVQNAVADAVEAVTPFDLPRPDDTAGGGTPTGLGPETADVRAPATVSAAAPPPVEAPVLTTLSEGPAATAAASRTAAEGTARMPDGGTPEPLGRDDLDSDTPDELERDGREQPRRDAPDASDRDAPDEDAPDADAPGSRIDAPEADAPDIAPDAPDAPDARDDPETARAPDSALPDGEPGEAAPGALDSDDPAAAVD